MSETPRNVLAQAIHDEFSDRPMHSVTQREQRAADAAISALSAAGFEIVPSALVDEVLAGVDQRWRWGLMDEAAEALRAYRESQRLSVEER